MSFFAGARGVHVAGGTYTVHNRNAEPDGQKGLDLLNTRVAHGAFHNSLARSDSPRCHPHTRTAVIEEITNWVENPGDRRFMWLGGPAGSGKTAIAQSIAELCFRTGKLAGSFFFSRMAAERNNESLLVTTLAYQLILSLPEIRVDVGQALERDPHIVFQSLEVQMQKLIIDPILTNYPKPDAEAVRSRPKLIIVDGLDECGDSSSQQYVLHTLANCCWGDIERLPLLFLVASRPERHIREAFDNRRFGISNRIFLDNTYLPDKDIETFLLSKFNDIKRMHPAGGYLAVTWPSIEKIERLVQKASGQFIYASVAMRFIESPENSPEDRLDIVLGLSLPDKHTPFAELDTLYRQIMSSIPQTDKVSSILSVLFLVKFHKLIPHSIDDFLAYKRGTVRTVLSSLLSILILPPPTNEDGEIQIHHASLADFLFDKARSESFYIDPGIAHASISRCIIKRIQSRGENPRETEDYVALIGHCTKAYPTQELLKDLYSFDFSHYLEWFQPTSIILNRELVISRIPSEVIRSGADSLASERDGETTVVYDQIPPGGFSFVSSENSVMDAYLEMARTDSELQILKCEVVCNETHINALRPAGEIPQLLLWLRGKRLPSHAEDLLLHHQSTIDDWIRHQLASTEITLPMQNQKITGSLLNQIFYGIQGLDDVTDILMDDSRVELQQSADAIILATLSHLLDCDASYYSLMLDFLNDPIWAGPYFFDGDKYGRLAYKMMNFIIRHHLHIPTSDDDRQKYPFYDRDSSKNDHALTLLPFLLAKASDNMELAELFEKHPFQLSDLDVATTRSKRHEAAKAIQLYLAQCHVVSNEKPRKRRPQATWSDSMTLALATTTVLVLTYAVGYYSGIRTARRL